MNILKDLQFNSDKPAVLPLRKTEKINVIAVELLETQIQKKHKTSIPSLLTVLKGSFMFSKEEETIELKPFDTYQIPVDTIHEVHGLEKQNIFTLTQEK